MKTLCLVLDDSIARSLWSGVDPDQGEFHVMAFSPGSQTGPAVHPGFRSAKPLDVRERYREVLPDARERFIRFVAEWPENYKIGNQNFKQWLLRDGNSLWWFMELSQRNPESSPVFNTYCIAEIVRRELRRGKFEKVIALGGDLLTGRVLRSICAGAGVAFESRGAKKDSLPLWKLLARRARAGAKMLIRMRLARRRPGAPVDAETQTSPRVAFHSWFPVQWTDFNGRLRDRYFVDLPDYIAGRGGAVLYACSFAGLKLADIRRAARAVDDLLPELRRRVVWLESYSRVWDLIRAYSDLRLWLRLEWLILTDRELKKSLARSLEVDLSPVLLRDLRGSVIVELPNYLLLSNQMRSFTREYRPTHVITTLETYCYGRAVTSGVRSAGVGARVVGLQHSPVNRNQLFYCYKSNELSGPESIPLPDGFLLHSRLAENFLRDAGVPGDSLHLVGAPRFAVLESYRQRRLGGRESTRRELKLPESGPLVLVAGTIWHQETVRLLEWSFEAAAVVGQRTLLIKTHPIERNIDSMISGLARRFPTVTWLKVEHSLNALQAVSDVTVTGNSGSDVEALAIGCPVIKTGTFDIGASPTEEFPGCVTRVDSVADLATALKELRPLGGRPPVVDWALGPIDQLANARIYKVLTSRQFPEREYVQVGGNFGI